MHALQAMTHPVVTVPADATVFAAADLLLGSRISAAPVVDADGKLVGIVSEADLMNRPEVGTVPAKSWMQRLLADNALLARDYIRSHSHRVADVMTREVITAGERTQLAEIARLMERHHIKRVPIVRDGKVIGIVSRANLLQGLLAREPHPPGRPGPGRGLAPAIDHREPRCRVVGPVPFSPGRRLIRSRHRTRVRRPR